MPNRAGRVRRALGFGVLALALTLLGGGIWTALLVANLATSPKVPWSAPAMALVLWALWRYLGGSGPPRSTSEARRRGLRAERVAAPVLAWALVAGGLSIVALTGLWIVLFQLVKSPGNALPDYAKYSPVTVALVLVTASAVGAITEEAGFRGYLQGYLEREFRAPVAIAGAALMMAPGHGLTQGFVWSTLFFYFCVDMMFGVTAHLTGSIVPGILTHAAGLLVFFTLIWPEDGSRHLIAEEGATTWFWIHVGQTIAFAALALLAFMHLARRRRAEPIPS